MKEKALINRGKALFEIGKKYLLRRKPKRINEGEIIRYLAGMSCPRKTTMPALYRQMLSAAQTANMKPGVIGKAIGGIDSLGRVLFDFDINAVLDSFANSEQILDRIVDVLNPKGEIRRGPRCIWPRYCKTIQGAARFLAQFGSTEEFYGWGDRFVDDPRSRLALPLLLSEEIPGFGFALACEFLKESGYMEYAKPDVHLRDILIGTGICHKKESDYSILKAILRVSESAGVTPFEVDKVFWLIGSGRFGDVKKSLGDEVNTKSMKKDFIAYAQKRLV
jgi:hypothetical protein